MKNKINLLDLLQWLGWIFLIILLFFRGCNPEIKFTEKIKVITKQLKGTIVTKEKIIHVPIIKTLKDTSGTGFYVNQIDKLFEENQQMQLEFIKMDSLQQIQAYNKAIEIRQFEHTFDDEYIKAQVRGEVSGEVKQMRFDYTIKPQQITADTPKRKISALGGVFIANDIQLQKPLFGAELNVLNNKGNLLKIAYDNEKRIYLGYSKKLF
jgi:hypothetical protein